MSARQDDPIARASIPPHYRLGATLYVPGTHADLGDIISGRKLPEVRSIVICTEDAVTASELPVCYRGIRNALRQPARDGLLVFIRPRSPDVLARLLAIPEVAAVRGFVLPKLDFTNMDAYRRVLERYRSFGIMPTIETDVAFYRSRIRQLGRELSRFANDLICVRIGGNDLMALLGIRHPEEHTIYDTPMRTVIDDILLGLRPQGIEVSAPVFDFIDRPRLLAEEVALDRARGFLSKTAIHPCQISVIENGLQVCDEQRAVARRVLAEGAAAVFQMSGGMCEPMTHRVWARRIELTGVVN